MTKPEKHHVYAACATAIVIVLLLLWKHNSNNAINYVQSPSSNLGGLVSPINNYAYDVGGIDVQPIVNRNDGAGSYNFPGVSLPGNGFDWMQTTDCMCDCEEGWSAPQAALLPPVILSFPFASYVAPTTPTWWFSSTVGKVVTNYDYYKVLVNNAAIIQTSDGQRFAVVNTEEFGDVNKGVRQFNGTLQSGETFYADGKRYVHNPTKDKPGVSKIEIVGGPSTMGG